MEAIEQVDLLCVGEEEQEELIHPRTHTHTHTHANGLKKVIYTNVWDFLGEVLDSWNEDMRGVEVRAGELVALERKMREDLECGWGVARSTHDHAKKISIQMSIFEAVLEKVLSPVCRQIARSGLNTSCQH